MTQPAVITVVIAAYKAAATIRTAVRSALAEPEVAEVVVVDDCSGDDTPDAAVAAACGDPRLRVLRQSVNRGPAAARNRAIAESDAPYVSILDADDAIVPGRFARILATQAWDFCADNIVFVTGTGAFDAALTRAGGSERSCYVDFEAFVEANIPRRHRQRGELGFLKPVMRRDFLVRHQITYCEDCRLGEDFLLYTKALAAGARFRLLENCGYAALRRPDSLSGRHDTGDLIALLRESEALLPRLEGNPRRRKALEAHIRSTREKVMHREVLDIRQRDGLAKGLLALTRRPTAARDILRDRLAPLAPCEAPVQTLISPSEFERLCQ